MIKWLNLSPENPNLKNKDTFFSRNVKVEEKKVPLFFGFGASGLRYSQFVIFMIALTQSQTKKMRKCPYLCSEAPNPKNKEEKKVRLLPHPSQAQSSMLRLGWLYYQFPSGRPDLFEIL